MGYFMLILFKYDLFSIISNILQQEETNVGLTTNTVTAGKYKNGDIKIKGIGKTRVVIETRGLFGKTEHILDKKTVDHIELMDKAQGVTSIIGMQHYYVAIYYKNGKKSFVKMEYNIYNALNAALF